MQASWKQTTLDDWLSEDKEVSEKQQAPNNNNTASEFVRENKVYTEGFLDDWDDTICNTELDMRHDENGNVLGWMEGDPNADEWDGSVDNKIKNLEDYVSKRGWLF